jgi:hypothetical protein
MRVRCGFVVGGLVVVAVAAAGCGGSDGGGGGGLDRAQERRLLGEVDAARAAARAGDRSRADAALTRLRREVAGFERSGALSGAQARTLRDTAIQAQRRVEAEVPAPAAAPPLTASPAAPPPAAGAKGGKPGKGPKGKAKGHGGGKGKGD